MAENGVEFEDLIQPVLSKIGLELSAGQVSGLEQHYRLLRHWNRRINLTAITDPQQIAERHFGESLWVAKRIGPGAGTVVDVGSGAGFPGIPIAVWNPALTVTLVESVAKKVAFLKETSRGLANVRVFHGRLEDLQASFGWATVRGVEAEELMPILSRMADRLIFVIAASKAGVLTKDGRFEWKGPEPLAWGRGSVLLMGEKSPEGPTLGHR